MRAQYLDGSGPMRMVRSGYWNMESPVQVDSAEAQCETPGRHRPSLRPGGGGAQPHLPGGQHALPPQRGLETPRKTRPLIQVKKAELALILIKIISLDLCWERVQYQYTLSRYNQTPIFLRYFSIIYFLMTRLMTFRQDFALINDVRDAIISSITSKAAS